MGATEKRTRGVPRAGRRLLLATTLVVVTGMLGAATPIVAPDLLLAASAQGSQTSIELRDGLEQFGHVLDRLAAKAPDRPTLALTDVDPYGPELLGIDPDLCTDEDVRACGLLGPTLAHLASLDEAPAIASGLQDALDRLDVAKRDLTVKVGCDAGRGSAAVEVTEPDVDHDGDTDVLVHLPVCVVRTALLPLHTTVPGDAGAPATSVQGGKAPVTASLRMVADIWLETGVPSDRALRLVDSPLFKTQFTIGRRPAGEPEVGSDTAPGVGIGDERALNDTKPGQVAMADVDVDRTGVKLDMKGDFTLPDPDPSTPRTVAELAAAESVGSISWSATAVGTLTATDTVANRGAFKVPLAGVQLHDGVFAPAAASGTAGATHPLRRLGRLIGERIPQYLREATSALAPVRTAAEADIPFLPGGLDDLISVVSRVQRAIDGAGVSCGTPDGPVPAADGSTVAPGTIIECKAIVSERPASITDWQMDHAQLVNDLGDRMPTNPTSPLRIAAMANTIGPDPARTVRFEVTERTVPIAVATYVAADGARTATVPPTSLTQLGGLLRTAGIVPTGPANEPPVNPVHYDPDTGALTLDLQAHQDNVAWQPQLSLGELDEAGVGLSDLAVTPVGGDAAHNVPGVVPTLSTGPTSVDLTMTLGIRLDDLAASAPGGQLPLFLQAGPDGRLLEVDHLEAHVLPASALDASGRIGFLGLSAKATADLTTDAGKKAISIGFKDGVGSIATSVGGTPGSIADAVPLNLITDPHVVASLADDLDIGINLAMRAGLDLAASAAGPGVTQQPLGSGHVVMSWTPLGGLHVDQPATDLSALSPFADLAQGDPDAALAAVTEQLASAARSLLDDPALNATIPVVNVSVRDALRPILDVADGLRTASGLDTGTGPGATATMPYDLQSLAARLAHLAGADSTVGLSVVPATGGGKALRLTLARTGSKTFDVPLALDLGGGGLSLTTTGGIHVATKVGGSIVLDIPLALGATPSLADGTHIGLAVATVDTAGTPAASSLDVDALLGGLSAELDGSVTLADELCLTLQGGHLAVAEHPGATGGPALCPAAPPSSGADALVADASLTLPDFRVADATDPDDPNATPTSHAFTTTMHASTHSLLSPSIAPTFSPALPDLSDIRLDLGQLFRSLPQLLDRVGSVLQTAAPLPLLGDALDAGAGLVEKLNTDIVQPLDTKVRALLAHLPTEATSADVQSCLDHAVNGLLQNPASTPSCSTVTTVDPTALHATVTLLCDTPIGTLPCVATAPPTTGGLDGGTISLPPSPIDSIVDVAIRLQGVKQLAPIPIRHEGSILPGLPIRLDGGLSLTPALTFDVTVGLDKHTGPYVTLGDGANGKPLELAVTVDVDGSVRSDAAAPAPDCKQHFPGPPPGALDDYVDTECVGLSLGFLEGRLWEHEGSPSQVQVEASLFDGQPKTSLAAFASGLRPQPTVGFCGDLDLLFRAGTTSGVLPAVFGVVRGGFGDCHPPSGVLATDPSAWSLGFDDVYLDAGSILDRIVKPIQEHLGVALGPVTDVLGLLHEPVPILSNLYDLIGKPAPTVRDLLATVPGTADALAFLDGLEHLLTLTSGDTGLPPRDDGTGTTSGLIALGPPSGDHENQVRLNPVVAQQATAPGADALVKSSTVRDSVLPPAPGTPAQSSLASVDQGSAASAAPEQDDACPRDDAFGVPGLSFPLLSAPGHVIDLLLGQDVTLVCYRAPSTPLEARFPIPIGSVPLVAPVTVSADVAFHVGLTPNLGFGIDTSGIRSAVETTGDATDVVDGLFLTDFDDEGHQVDELQLSAGFEASLGVGIDLFIASVTGGLFGDLTATVGVGLNDQIHPDGKVTWAEAKAFVAAGQPQCLFQVTEELKATLGFFLEFEFLFYSKRFSTNLLDGTLASFRQACTFNPPKPATVADASDGSSILVLNDTGYSDEFVVRPGVEPGTFDVVAFGLTETYSPSSGRVFSRILMEADGQAGYRVDDEGNGGDDIVRFMPNVAGAVVDLPVELHGGPDNDTLTGLTGNDVLDGGSGDDILIGGPGVDCIDGGDDSDTIFGGEGSEGVVHGDGTDCLGRPLTDLDYVNKSKFYDGAPTEPMLFGGAGDDRIYGELGDDVVDGGPGDDTILGGPAGAPCDPVQASACPGLKSDGIDELIGGRGADSIDGGDGRDLLWGDGRVTTSYPGVAPCKTPTDEQGLPCQREAIPDGTPDCFALAGAGAGNDYLRGGGGDDILLGGGGDDALFGAGGSDTICGNRGVDTLDGDSSARDSAPGQVPTDGGNDVLDGGQDGDILFGGPGADDLVGGTGRDDLTGGLPGDPDVALPAGSDTDVLVGGSADLAFGVDGLAATRSGRSLAALISETGPDAVVEQADARLIDYDVEDEKRPPACRVPERPDTDDCIAGGADDDVVLAGAGDDSVDAGAGNDVVIGGTGADLIHGRAGIDQLQGDDGADELHGDLGDDTLIGGVGKDRLYGEGGVDRLHGDGPGPDGPDSHDPAAAGEDDLLDGGTGKDHLFGDGGADELFGGADADVLFGGAGADKLHGDEGTDELHGETDNDDLWGDAGGDDLGGGSGTDVVHYGSAGRNLGVKDDPTPPAAESPVTVTVGGPGTPLLDEGAGTADDGVTDEHDNVRSSVEVVLGTSGNDVIRALDANVPHGLYGGAGDDILSATGVGNDTLSGQAGKDSLSGGDGADVLFGGSGDDEIDAVTDDNGRLADNVDGGAGDNDRCQVRPIEDQVIRCERTVVLPNLPLPPSIRNVLERTLNLVRVVITRTIEIVRQIRNQLPVPIPRPTPTPTPFPSPFPGPGTGAGLPGGFPNLANLGAQIAQSVAAVVARVVAAVPRAFTPRLPF